MTCIGMAFFPTNFMLQASHDQDDHHTPYFLSPILQPCTTTHQDFHGVASFLDKRSIPYATEVCDQETNNGDDEGSDDGLLGGEKKKRLNMEQVKTLERNFAIGNKLDPERKMQLAKALGLQPRQIAIWFQNRRARWKTKQLEKDYDVLKKQFEAIKAQNDSLLSQNHKLHVEIMALKNKEPTESINLNIKETEGSCSNKSENSSEIKLNMISRTTPVTTDSMISSQNHHHHPIPNQIFHNSSSRPEYDHHHNNNNIHAQLKLDQPVNNKDESLCNMFVGMEDQSGFWPWLEQQPQFN